MLNPFSKLFVATAVTVFVVGVARVVSASDDRIGFVTLIAVGAVALFLAVCSLMAGLNQAVKDIGVTSAEESFRDTGKPVTRVSKTPEPWPVIAAIAVGMLILGVTESVALVIGAFVVGAVAWGGWLAAIWRQDESWSPGLRERTAERLLRPVALPVTGLLLAAIIAVSLSRVLLATSKNGAVGIALLVAVVLMLGATAIASLPRLRSSFLTLLSMLALASVVVAGGAGAMSGERDFESHGHGEEHDTLVRIAAQGLAYVQPDKPSEALKSLTIHGHSKGTHIYFDNREGDLIFHNVGVYGPDGGKPIWNGTPVPGGSDVTDVFPVELEPGSTYVFRCDFHPNMVGELRVSDR